MPTGYTAVFEEKNITLRQFAMDCATAFLIEMRDSSSRRIPNEFTPSNYHAKEIKKAKQTLEKTLAMSDIQVSKEAEKSYHKELNSHRNYIASQKILTKRYARMIDKVKNWEPPTPQHKGLKKFMLEQLKTSLESESGYCPETPQRMTPKMYREKLINEAKRDVKYHQEEYKKDVNRAENTTEWVRALRKSLS